MNHFILAILVVTHAGAGYLGYLYGARAKTTVDTVAKDLKDAVDEVKKL
jgi:hypothetical protein